MDVGQLHKFRSLRDQHAAWRDHAAAELDRLSAKIEGDAPMAITKDDVQRWELLNAQLLTLAAEMSALLITPSKSH